MKLLMENWRKYVAESEQTSHYGDLYLFENDTVTKTSFYDALNTLSESDGDVDTFLENWENSIDHMFENLNEAVPIETGVGVVDNAILKASTQAYLALQKLKGKAVGPVMKAVNKIKNYAEKNPKTAQAAFFIGTALAGAAAATAYVHLQQDNSMDMQGLQDTMQTMISNFKTTVNTLEDTAIKAMQDFDFQANAPGNQAATSFKAPEGWEYWGDGEWLSPEFIKQQQAELEQIGNQVSKAIDDPGLEQAMSGWEDSIEQQMQGDPGFFADAETAKDVATQAQGSIDWIGDFMPPDHDPEVFNEYGPYGKSIINWGDDATPDEINNALERAAEQWAEFKEMAETFESGGSLEDLNMTRKDFKRWATDSVHAPNRPDNIARNIGRGVKAVASNTNLPGGTNDLDAGRYIYSGRGMIPPSYMKMLRKVMRASLK